MLLTHRSVDTYKEKRWSEWYNHDMRFKAGVWRGPVTTRIKVLYSLCREK